MKKMLIILFVALFCSSCVDTSQKEKNEIKKNIPPPMMASQEKNKSFNNLFLDSSDKISQYLYTDTPSEPDPNVQCFYPVEKNTFKQASTLACIHKETGNFTWKPGKGDAGEYEVTFTASDGNGGSDSEIITITIVERPNEPPIIFAKREKRKNIN